MFKSFFNWKVGANVLVAIGCFVGVVWATFRWLDFHTNHGKEIPVPNVVDMPIHQAVKVLEDMGLEVEVDSFKYEPKYKPFQVLQIYPTAGSRVKEGRAIMLKVNPRTWAKVEVPDILDKYKGLAYSRLELVGLKIGDTIYEPNIQKDAVIRMEFNGNEVKPGSLLPKFSNIDLVIGSGPMRNIAVPNVVGLTVKEARVVIKKNHFELGFVDFADGQDENAIVYYQDPERGAQRDQGMQVDIWASKKSSAEMLNKIKELDKIYRKYEEVQPAEEDFGFIDEDFVQRTQTVPEKPKEKPASTKEKNNSPVEKPKNNTATKPKETAVEKPKGNNVIVE